MRQTNRVARASIGLVVMIGALVALPAPAWAHTELEETSPADGDVVTSPIEEVTLTFSEPVQADGSTVTVTGPDGQSLSTGSLSVLDEVVHQPIAPPTSGEYQVEWSVVSDDGHPVTGQFTFQVNLPPELETTPPPAADPTDAAGSPAAASDDSGGSSSVVLWVAAAVVVIAAAVTVVLRVRRRRTG